VSDAQLLCAAAHPATYFNHSYRLSAHLANLTSNDTYLDAALMSANFSSRRMFDPTTKLLWQELDLGEQCVINSNETLPKQPFQTGSFIEALSVLANLTDDIKWTSLYVGVTQGVAVFVYSRKCRMLTLLNSSMSADWNSTTGGVMQDVLNRNMDDTASKGMAYAF
jgi:hypothetical protein